MEPIRAKKRQRTDEVLRFMDNQMEIQAMVDATPYAHSWGNDDGSVSIQFPNKSVAVARFGDWILVNPDGEVSVLPHDTFWSDYELLDGGLCIYCERLFDDEQLHCIGDEYGCEPCIEASHDMTA